MRQFLIRIAGFGVCFLAVSAVLLLADLYVYDYNSNTVLNDVQKLENKVVVIGSSKIRYGLIKDSLQRHFPAEVYAEGGQYNLESLNFLFNKHRRGEIGRGNLIFIDLESGDPLATSFRKFNWFAENFTIYGFYPWSAFPAEKYPKILSRIYVDILATGVNKTTPFEWRGLGTHANEHPETLVDMEQYHKYCSSIPSNLTNDSLFTETMGIVHDRLVQLERETGSKVYMLVPPGSHMLNNAEVISRHFPAERVIDLNCISGLEDTACWFDGNHLRPKGAEIFTRRFIEVATGLRGQR